jgi:hypothetical protein
MTGDSADPTELAGVATSDTEAVYAWAFDESDELVKYRPPWIARTAIAVSLVLMAAAGTVAVLYVREESAPVASPVSTPTTMPPAATSAAPPPTSTDRRAAGRGAWGQENPLPIVVPTVTVTAPAPVTETVSAAPAAGSDYDQITPAALAAMDRQFVANLQGQGWQVWDPVLMGQRGHQTCALLQRGNSTSDVVRVILADNATPPYQDRDINMAQQFVLTATRTYPSCP